MFWLWMGLVANRRWSEHSRAPCVYYGSGHLTPASCSYRNVGVKYPDFPESFIAKHSDESAGLQNDETTMMVLLLLLFRQTETTTATKR